MLPNNYKVIIDGKGYDLTGFCKDRCVSVTIRGKIEVYDFKKVQILRGTGMKGIWWEYDKRNPVEIYEADVIEFYDDSMRKLRGEVFYKEESYMWQVRIYKNPFGYEAVALYDVKSPWIAGRAFEVGGYGC